MNWNLIVNSAASIASIFAFVLALHLLWKGSAENKRTRSRITIMYTVFATVCFVLLSFATLQIKHEIETVSQMGTFRDYPIGEHEVYYRTPYKQNPHLHIRLNDPYHRGGQATIIEQRPDGFRIRLGGLADLWEWEASGIPVDSKVEE